MGRPAILLRNRFWNNVNKKDDNSCWLWLGYLDKGGYGTTHLSSTECINAKSRTVWAHRAAYELLIGPIPSTLVIDHLCRNRGCVNPKHMELVTSKENVMRGMGICAKNKVKTHCPKGHVLSGVNLYAYGNRRHCRTCNKATKARYRQRERNKTRERRK